MKPVFLSIALLAVAQGVMAQQGSWADYASDNVLPDEGSESTYTISSEADLAWVAKQVNDGEKDFYGCTINLADDLDLSDYYWEPIGYGTEGEDYQAFMGAFNGNGKTISGLYIDKPEGLGVGLFGYIHNPARIENVKIATSEIKGNFMVGAIVGNYCGRPMNENVGIFNCEVGADVTVTAVAEGDFSGSTVGGIIGYLEYATISHCINAATVIGDEATGGIAGMFAGGEDQATLKPCTVTECYNLGTVTENDAVESGYWITRFTDTNDAIFNITFLDDDRDAAINNDKRIFNYEGATVNVTLKDRTLYKDRSWNTFCVPFGFENSDLRGPSLASPTIMEFEYSEINEENGELSLDFVGANGVESGHTYLIKWEVEEGNEEEVNSPVFENVVMGRQESLMPREVDQGPVSFKGIYTPYSSDGINKSVLFVGAGDKLLYPESAMTIGAFRAYFELPEGVEAGQPDPTDPESSIKSFVLNFGDEGTGISEIHLSEPAAPWYSLDGCKLSGKPATKGLYVQNGKKMMIK